MPTAIIAPEISPPGRFAHRNSRPPAVPMTSVSSVPRILARSAMAEDIEAGIRLTPPYGKSAREGQMRSRDCSNARWRRRWPAGVMRNAASPDAALEQMGGLVSSPFRQRFLHSERNFLRSLPCNPLASASFEHSSEAEVRGFSAFLSAGALASVLVAAVLAGAVVCAEAGPSAAGKPRQSRWQGRRSSSWGTSD